MWLKAIGVTGLMSAVVCGANVSTLRADDWDDYRERLEEWREDQRERYEDERERYEEWLEDQQEARDDYLERLEDQRRRAYRSGYRSAPPVYYYGPQAYPRGYGFMPPYYAPQSYNYGGDTGGFYFRGPRGRGLGVPW